MDHRLRSMKFLRTTSRLTKSPRIKFGIQSQFLRGFTALGIAMLLCVTPLAYSQSQFTRIYGPEDQMIVMPSRVGTAGQQDASALQEISEYRTVLNAPGWSGLAATGTFTDSSGNADPATVTIVGSSHFRLDVTTSEGERSTRISGPYGSIREVNGAVHALPPATALGEVLVFPRLLAPVFPGPATTVVDDGQVLVEGTSLHRITIEAQAFPSTSTPAQLDPNRALNVTDLYFDPTTHLLVKSASYVQLNQTDHQRYLIVLTYGDYQNVGGTLLPLKFVETMDGQPEWVLQLGTPSLQPSVDPSYFHF